MRVQGRLAVLLLAPVLALTAALYVVPLGVYLVNGFYRFKDGRILRVWTLDTYRAWAASHPPDEPPPGEGESRAQAAARFAAGLRHVLARPEENVLVVGHALAIRYLIDAASGDVPAARMAPIEHAYPYRLDRADAERAATLLEEWSRAPSFRTL